MPKKFAPTLPLPRELELEGHPISGSAFGIQKDPSKAKLLRNLRGAKSFNDFKAIFEDLESEEND